MGNIKDIIAEKVMEYYSTYPELMRRDILHTQEVVSYTRLIAVGECASQREVDLMECAAWLHDIGCPKSKDIYGNALPVNQQKVGRCVCEEFLADFTELSQEEKTYLVDIVGTHHMLDKAMELKFMPLFEADMIANILSGYFPRNKVPVFYKTFIKTPTGKKFFKIIFEELREV